MFFGITISDFVYMFMDLLDEKIYSSKLISKKLLFLYKKMFFLKYCEKMFFSLLSYYID